MKVWITGVRAPHPLHYGANLNPTRFAMMELELRVDSPKTMEEAQAQYEQAKEWAYPTDVLGSPVPAPPVLELGRPAVPVDVPDFEWPTCQGCALAVEVRNIGDGRAVEETFIVRCPACARQASALTPLEALRKFNRGEFTE